jgi:hypothetical protein
LEINYNRGKSCGKIDCRTGITAHSRADKVVDPNLLTGLDHLSKQTTTHGTEMQGTSSQKHG